jgi:hypothetical protein
MLDAISAAVARAGATEPPTDRAEVEKDVDAIMGGVHQSGSDLSAQR